MKIHLRALFICLCFSTIMVILISQHTGHMSDAYQSRKARVIDYNNSNFSDNSAISSSIHPILSSPDSNGTKVHSKLKLIQLTSLGDDDDVSFQNIPSINTFSRLLKLDWTFFNDKRFTHHVFSAYFDGRTSSKLMRPAVIVMGYVHKDAPDLKVYCSFKYLNSTRKCSKTPATRRHVSACWQPTNKFIPFHYVCQVDSVDDPPLTVQLCTSENCAEKRSTSELPVRNRDVSTGKMATKKFGICIGGPLVQEDGNLLREVIEFVEMSGLLGAELIVFYVNETQVSPNILQHLWRTYPNLVRTIGWRRFEKWEPFHYYGQLLMISDCFYRHMYEVEYIAMIDLDEMILPTEHSTWGELMESLNNSEQISSYYFQNRFFTGKRQPGPLPNCSGIAMPKYFTKTRRIECLSGYEYRPKLVSRPRNIYEPSVHWNCAAVEGCSDVHVPPEAAVLGHYKATIPKECVKNPSKVDERTLRFKDPLLTKICSRF